MLASILSNALSNILSNILTIMLSDILDLLRRRSSFTGYQLVIKSLLVNMFSNILYNSLINRKVNRKEKMKIENHVPKLHGYNTKKDRHQGLYRRY